MNASKRRNILWTALLASCFAVMVAFAPYLHSHEFDLNDAHQDCSPCHFSHSQAGLTSALAPLELDFAVVATLFVRQEAPQQTPPSLHSGRSPPTFS